jgi:hypothetical protein
MKAEHAARDLTYHAGQQSTSDSLFQVPPDPVFGCTTLQGEWPGAAAVNLDAFRPDGLDRLYLLGGCADIAREAAARMLRRCELIAVGDRIGRAAAGDAKSATALQVASVAAGQLAGGPAKDVREFLAPLRPTEAPRTVKQPARPIPVFGEFGAIVEGSQVKGVIVTTPDGRGAVLARTVIDATGSATVAAMAGAECIFTDSTDIAVQGTGLPPRYLGRDYTNTDYTIADENDMLDVSPDVEAGVRCRRLRRRQADLREDTCYHGGRDWRRRAD